MQQTSYAAYNKDIEMLEKSSSGAMFVAFSDYIFECDGVIVGASYDYFEHDLKHKICRNIEERDSCRGSKYIQSNIDSSIYKQIEEMLLDNKTVLYTGTPCQVAAIKEYMSVRKINQERLYTCDILCHGVGSPGIWDSFIKNLEKKKRTKIVFLTFKDKRKGWKKPLCVARDEKKEFSLRGYSWLYFSNSIMRPACYKCKYAKLERVGDITIGDFWKVNVKKPSMYNTKGTSFVMINSKKGEFLFENSKDKLVFEVCSIDDIIQNNMLRPTSEGKYREKIMHDYKIHKVSFFYTKWKMIMMINKIKKLF